MLVNLSKEYKVFANDYDPADWINFYDPETDYTIREVWDDGDNVWGEADYYEEYDEDYED